MPASVTLNPCALCGCGCIPSSFSTKCTPAYQQLPRVSDLSPLLSRLIPCEHACECVHHCSKIHAGQLLLLTNEQQRTPAAHVPQRIQHLYPTAHNRQPQSRNHQPIQQKAAPASSRSCAFLLPVMVACSDAEARNCTRRCCGSPRAGPPTGAAGPPSPGTPGTPTSCLHQQRRFLLSAPESRRLSNGRLTFQQPGWRWPVMFCRTDAGKHRQHGCAGLPTMVQPRIHRGWKRCLHCSCTLAPPGPAAPPRWLRASASCTYQGNSAECQVQHSAFGTQGQGVTLSGTIQQLQQMSSGEAAQKCKTYLAAADAAVVHRDCQLPRGAHHSCLRVPNADCADAE